MTGLLGGAFDPPHLGHLALAREALRRFQLERLVVVVTGQPPHKDVPTPAETRYRLAEAAFAGVEGVELSRWELERPGPSYTVDTVRSAAAAFGEVLLLVGADQFAEFPTWKDPDGVLEHARLGVAARPGYPARQVADVLARLSRPERVELFELDPVPISSREIRTRVACGAPVEDLVPGAVAALIRELGLYRQGS